MSFPLPPIVVEVVAQVVGIAIAAFLRTTAGMVTLGIAAAVGSFLYAASVSTLRGVLAVLAALAICGVIGVVLAAKRAALVAVRELGRRHRVGGRMVDAVFDRIAALPGVSTVERVPLAQAEQALTTVVRDHIDGDGFFRRRIAKRLVTSVEQLTLARFRTSEARDGGVELARVRADLAEHADALVDANVVGIDRRLTVVCVALALVLSCVAAVAIARV